MKSENKQVYTYHLVSSNLQKQIPKNPSLLLHTLGIKPQNHRKANVYIKIKLGNTSTQSRGNIKIFKVSLWMHQKFIWGDKDHHRRSDTNKEKEKERKETKTSLKTIFIEKCIESKQDI